MREGDSALVLVLGDQLNGRRGAVKNAVPGRDTILLAEVVEEATYARHSKLKIAFVFAAMRHFGQEMSRLGFEVVYLSYDLGFDTLESAVNYGLSLGRYSLIRVCEPGEYRVQQHLECANFPVALEWVPDDGFLASRQDFAEWAQGRKQLRMEYFYRGMRRRYDIMVDAEGRPAGGKWNFDANNRQGWKGGAEELPQRPVSEPDAVTQEVLTFVDREFAENPGDLASFSLAVTAAGAEAQLDWFLEHVLPHFGTYQDALAEASPWLFHGVISMYLNIGLLEPLQTILKVQKAWQSGHCDTAAAEGFIRQVLGWREYVRGMYWLKMPTYAELNYLGAMRPLPAFFWNAETDMRCLQRALHQSLDLGYAHHIQRLMVIGNFALLAGLNVQEVCEWFLAVYVDAFEWVELPNTLGMALHADGGVMASKPYAASGKYINRQGDHCSACRYRPDKTTGEDACPYNSLYWNFIDGHQSKFEGNPRMRLMTANWQRRPEAERSSIIAWANHELARLAPEEKEHVPVDL